MKKLFLSIMLIAILGLTLSCDKNSMGSSLLIGKWNWENPYPSNEARSYIRQSLEFTNNKFDMQLYYVDKFGTYPDKYGTYPRNAKGTYDYVNNILVLYPSEGDMWGDDTRKPKTYTVQTLNKTTLIMVYMNTGEVEKYTR